MRPGDALAGSYKKAVSMRQLVFVGACLQAMVCRPAGDLSPAGWLLQRGGQHGAAGVCGSLPASDGLSSSGRFIASRLAPTKRWSAWGSGCLWELACKRWFVVQRAIYRQQAGSYKEAVSMGPRVFVGACLQAMVCRRAGVLSPAGWFLQRGGQHEAAGVCGSLPASDSPALFLTGKGGLSQRQTAL